MIKHRLQYSGLLIIFIIFFQGCTMSLQEKYSEPYNEYVELKPNKAFALAEGKNGAHAFGYGSQYDTIKEAKERALLECRARKTAYKIEEKCKIYFVNGDKVTD